MSENNEITVTKVVTITKFPEVIALEEEVAFLTKEVATLKEKITTLKELKEADDYTHLFLKKLLKEKMMEDENQDEDEEDEIEKLKDSVQTLMLENRELKKENMRLEIRNITIKEVISCVNDYDEKIDKLTKENRRLIDDNVRFFNECIEREREREKRVNSEN